MAKKSCSTHKKFNYYCKECQRINESSSAIEEQPYFIFQINLIGKDGVGKTTFIKSLYTADISAFDINTGSTIGVDFYTYDFPIILEGKESFVRIAFWDLKDRFKRLFSYYLHGANGIFIVFDVSDLTSFHEIESQMEFIREKCPENRVPIILLGNKTDKLKHFKNAKDLATLLVKKYGLVGYYEISALQQKGTKQAFHALVEAILKKFDPDLKKIKTKNSIINL
jgi:small GTP-binding protein